MTADAVAAPGAAALAIQIATGLLFLGAGVQKLLHWQEFRGIVAAYRLLPAALVPIAAALIAPLELLLGVGGVLHRAMPYTSYAMAVLLIAFAVAMAVNIRRGRTEIHCGCFRAALRQELRWRLVIRNLVCALAVSSSSALPLAPAALVWLQAIPAGCALLCLYAAADAVWALDASQRAAFGRS